MTRRRKIKWVVLGSLLLLVLVGAIMFVQSRRTPSDYQPLALAAEEKVMAQDGLRRKLADFVQRAGEIGTFRAGEPIPPGQSFTLEITQKEMSEWVASLPEPAIAQLNGLGLSKPSVSIRQERLTFYAYYTKVKGVVGMDFFFAFDPTGMMRLVLKDMRVGELKLPRSLYDNLVKDLERMLNERLASMQHGGNSEFGGIPAPTIRKASAKVITTLHGEPIQPDIRESFGHVRIADIKLAKELATVRVVSLLEGSDLPSELPWQASQPQVQHQKP